MVLIGLLENRVAGLCWWLFACFPMNLAWDSGSAPPDANGTGGKAVLGPAKPHQQQQCQTKSQVHKH